MPGDQATRPRETPDSIYARVKQDISIGDLPEGTRLVETRLAERYEVSRTPVRQALIALERDGLLERDGRSLRVRSQSISEIMELYEIREILEEKAARLAAKRHEPSDALVLNHLVERMSTDLSVSDRYQVNRDFHTSIWRCSHHGVLVQTLEGLYASSVQGLATTLGGPDRWQSAVEEHRNMVTAILEGDEDKAAELLRAHIRTARDIRVNARLEAEATGQMASAGSPG